MKWKFVQNFVKCGCGRLALALSLIATVAATISAEAQTYKVIHTFTSGRDGIEPAEASLLLAPDGVHGVTYRGGGDSDTGTVFRIDKTGKEVLLVRFPGCCNVYPKGANPLGGLVRDAKGNLYGTTFLGGAQGGGTVFELDKAGKERVLHSFVNTDGARPRGGLIRNTTGNLYGTTQYGGIDCGGNGCGTVFKLDASGKLTVLYAFKGNFDGFYPIGNLVQDSRGNLYGITNQGGSFDCVGTGCGTVFRIDRSGRETILHVFLSSEPYGIFPFGGLIRDRAGNLYGTANAGGSSGENGTVFKLDPRGNMTVLYNFTGGSDGSGPAAPLIRDKAGNFYGTTEFGGDPSCRLTSIGCGTVFKLDTTGQETVLYRFTGEKDGGLPTSGLIIDASSNLYGTAPQGGDLGCETLGCGVVFEITP